MNFYASNFYSSNFYASRFYGPDDTDTAITIGAYKGLYLGLYAKIYEVGRI